MRQDNPGLDIYEYQTPSVLNQAAPVNGTFYPLLPSTDNCKVYTIGVNVEDADETLECRVTVDGVVYPAAAKAASHSVAYYPYSNPNPITRLSRISMNTVRNNLAYLFEGENILIELRKTTALGAGNLTGIVEYAVKTLV